MGDPDLIIGQLIELAGWQDAWRHELRGRDGRWIKAGSGGVLPASQRFGGGTDTWQPTTHARQNQLMGWPSEAARQRREHLEAVAKKNALRERQHDNRRAAGDTWTVDANGSIVRHAHPRPQNTISQIEQLLTPNGGLASKRPASRFHMLDVLGRSDHGYSMPRIGQKARGDGNIIGTVVGRKKDQVLLDADDGRSYLVNWRLGVVDASWPLSERGFPVAPSWMPPGAAGPDIPSAGGMFPPSPEQSLGAALRGEAARMRREDRARQLRAQGYGPESIRGIMDNETFGTRGQHGWRNVDSYGATIGSTGMGRVEPRVGDFMVDPGGVQGRVVQKIDDTVAIDGDDDFRHLVQWRSGQEISATPKEDIGPALPFNPPGPAPFKSMKPLPSLGEPPARAKGSKVLVPVDVEFDENAPNPDAPYKVRDVSGAEWHVSRAAAMGIIDEIQRRDAAAKKAARPAWKPEPVTPYGHASQAVQDLQKIIASGAIERGKVSHPEQGIQGDTQVVTLEDGTKVVHKIQDSKDRNDAEELSSYVSSVVGAGAPPIARPPGTDDELVEKFVAGGRTAHEYEDAKDREGILDPNGREYGRGQYAIDDMYDSPTGQKIGLLDYLTSNYDRHEGNWMVDDQDRPVPIDMGLASFDGDETTSPFWSHFKSTSDNPQDEALSASDWETTYNGLVQLKPEFDRLGRSGWYSSMMSNLGKLNEAQARKHNITIKRSSYYGYANPMELGWRFDPDEPRDAHGRWTHSGHGYEVPDTNRLFLPRPAHPTKPYYGHPRDHPFFAAHPVSAENIVSAFDQASPEEVAQGMRWYADAHTLAKAIGQGDVTKGAGLLAAYSPQSPWPVNMFNAARAMELGRAIGPGEGMITGSMQHHAEGAMNGLSTDDNFGRGAPKIRAFARLIEHGGDAPDDRYGQVVLDRHAMSVAMGVRLPKKESDQAPIDKERYYQHVADQYRIAAAKISARGTPVTPHQVQAITWLRQQRANAAEDKAGAVGHGGRGAGKGRQVMISRAWQNWKQLEQAEHYPVVSGTTEMAGTITGQLLDFAAWEHELRDSRGRWTRFGGVSSAADVMMKNREGFSVSVASGNEPVHGYMVAQTDHTHTYPASILDDHEKLTRAIDDMLVSEKSAFRGRGDVYLGGWVHDNKLWLEPSDNIASRQLAVHEGTQRNQIAIWDVDNGEEIQTGGSGGGRITEHANPQGAGQGPGGLRGPARGRAPGDRLAAGRPDQVGGQAVTEAWPDEFEDVVELTGTDTIVGQLLDLAGEAWRHERRGPGGQWVRTPGGDIRSPGGTVRTPGGTLRRSMTPGASPQQRARRVQQIQRRHEQAQTAVAERLAEEKARQALEEAKNEVEKVSEQLKEESKTEEQRKHRMKLALHAITVLGGALLAAVLAHFDVSPVIAGMSSGLPLIIQELVDFKKYL